MLIETGLKGSNDISNSNSYKILDCLFYKIAACCTCVQSHVVLLLLF